MKIILRLYNEIRFGNLSTMTLDLQNNKINVKELKHKIFEKYKIDPSKQRLTYKICHKKLITLPDMYPLSFFYIKDYSMIFLEIISNDEKQQKIKNSALNYKKDNLIKFKYMNKLGFCLPDEKTFLRDFKNLNDRNPYYFNNKKNSYSSKCVIEYNTLKNNSYISSAINSEEDSNNSLLFVNNNITKNITDNITNEENSFIKKNTDHNTIIIKELFSINLVEKLSFFVQQNDFKNVKIILSQYNNDLKIDLNIYNKIKEKQNSKRKESSPGNTDYKTSFSSEYNDNSIILNNNICEILNKNGWNAIHYSSFFGYSKILDLIINKFNIKSNINIVNNEGWSPLLLAVQKQQIKCVEILMAYYGIDVNYNGPMGTALHIACKKNNRNIVSLLLYKADITIKDKNNKTPVEYTHDKNIIKLISKIAIKKLEFLDKSTDSYKNMENFINEYKHILIIKKNEKKENNKKNNEKNVLS